jgi:hypothetical protein
MPRSCDETVRETAEDWLACIDNLRKSGDVDAANQEYEAFVLEFAAESAEIGADK